MLSELYPTTNWDAGLFFAGSGFILKEATTVVVLPKAVEDSVDIKHLSCLESKGLSRETWYQLIVEMRHAACYLKIGTSTKAQEDPGMFDYSFRDASWEASRFLTICAN